MASTLSERAELTKFCSSRDWSKAIRVLDSLLARSCSIQDICNRAFCYSQLELHKHVIKDCDKALQLDPTLLQAYILKGRAFFALGRKEDAILAWEKGCDYALHQSADLKLLLELEELLSLSKDGQAASLHSHALELSDGSAFMSGFLGSGKLRKIPDDYDFVSVDDEAPHISSDSLPLPRKPSESSYIPNGSSNKIDGLKVLSSQLNGSQDRHPNRNSYSSNGYADESEICGAIDGTSELSSRSSPISIASSDMPEICSNLSEKPETCGEKRDDSQGSKRIFVSKISKTKSINVDFRLSRGIAEVNEGQYAHAISIFNQILLEDPAYPEALIGRGTAYAFKRELDAAIADFTKAIQSNQSAGEAWKRRGQARAALGESIEAIEDLTKALEFEPNSADILHERGIVNFKFKNFNAAVQDLSACVKLERDNKSAFTYLGLSLSSIGEYRKAEEAHLCAIQLDRNFLEAWGHLAQFYQDLAISDRALEILGQLLQIDRRFTKAYQLRGYLLHGMGDHRNAIKDLSIGLSLESSNIECLYLRGSCYHAVGEYKEAVRDYDAALDLELDSMEKFVLQCLAFYQKEIALYTASKISGEFCWFDIDGDIDPLFKEFWCKRSHPKNVCEKVYRQTPLRDSMKKGKLRKQDFTITKPKAALLLAADRIGKKIQYHCPGFLSNKRQHRMAGLAAIEIAQKVSRAWRLLQSERKHSTNKSTFKPGKKTRRREKLVSPSQNRGGAGCSSKSYSESSSSLLDDKSLGRCVMSWNYLYSLAVKWRQISEPCDPVVWVNKLSEEFNSGFGSHTPLILGQAKVVRYFLNFQRTLDVAKAVIKEKMHVYSKTDDAIDLSKDGKIEEIMKAETCSDLYKVVGEDFWLATWCTSTAFEGRCLEGTRITLVKMGETGYDFAIRTPCTPARWDLFDTEMSLAWEALCNAYCGETYGSTDFDVLENVRGTILRMTYYWYNFMPLSRGSAAVGFIVMLGLLLAANMEFTGSIPEGVQVDWEAILNFNPNCFMDSVKSWMYPSLTITTAWKDYPDVASTFDTTGSVIAALSSYSD